jgi:hypothetical protein
MTNFSTQASLVSVAHVDLETSRVADTAQFMHTIGLPPNLMAGMPNTDSRT